MNSNIFWVLALIAPTAVAAPNFAPVEVLGTTPQSCNLQTAIAADLDGDGRADLLTADNCSQTGESIGTHSIHMNRGVLGFETVGTVPGADVITDFDGDGLLDLAWLELDPTSGAGITRWSVLLALGLGDGQFGAAVAVTSATAPLARLVSGDLEGDGDPDLFVSWSYGLRALRNDAGIFIAAPDLSFQDGSLAVQALYFDSDSFVDLMAAPGVVLLGGGDGSFPGRGRIQGPEGFLTFSTSRAWNLDLDGDGDLDLIAHGNYFDVVPNASLLSLMRGADGVLRYTASLYMDRFESSFYPSRNAALVDLDGDGRLELAYQSRLYQCFVPFACPAVLNGPTTFASVDIAADGAFTQQAGFRGGSFAFGDVDGDGRADAVGVFGSNIVWRRSVSTPNSAPIAPAEARLRLAFNADFEDQWLHIGASDIDDNVIRYQTLASQQRTGAVLTYANGWVHYAPGTSTLGGTETFLLETDDGAGGRAQTRLVVEVQGVGRAGGGAPDLLWLGLLFILVLVLRSRRERSGRLIAVLMLLSVTLPAIADVNLTAPVRISTFQDFESTIQLIGDLDGDGRPDILSLQEDRMALERNLGARQFTRAWAQTLPSQIHRAEIAELDGQPGLDLLLLEYSDYSTGLVTLAAWLNDGSGRLLAGPRSSVTGNLRDISLWVHDLDDDGSVEAVIHAQSFLTVTDAMHVYRNDGAGAFSLLQVHANPAGYSTGRLQDLDRDGRMDLWYPSTTAPLYAPGLTGGGFDAPVATTLPGTEGVRFDDADLDGDGDLDRLVHLADVDARRPLRTWRRDGGAWVAWGDTNLPQAFGGGFVALVDFDGDDRLEYLRSVSSIGSLEVSASHWLEIAVLGTDGRFTVQGAGFELDHLEWTRDLQVTDFDADGRADILTARLSPHLDGGPELILLGSALRWSTAAPNQEPLVEDQLLTMDLRDEGGSCCGTRGTRMVVSDPDGNLLTFTIVAPPQRGNAYFRNRNSPFVVYQPRDNLVLSDDWMRVEVDDGAGGVRTVRVRIFAIGSPNHLGGGGAPDLFLLGALAVLSLSSVRRRAARA